MYRFFSIFLKTIVGAVFTFACFFIFSSTAHAASLYLSPSIETYRVGQSFSLNVYVGSDDQAVNTVVASLRYSPDSLEVKSITLGGSFINLWIQQPIFDNTKGVISFEGGAFTPGYTGRAGKVATINFKVKGTKNGIVDFTSAQVLANDGLGTNILKTQSSSRFTLVQADVPLPSKKPDVSKTPEQKPPEQTVQVEVPPEGAIETPIISSATHPDMDTWYQSNSVVFEWLLPKNITQVAFWYDDKAINNDLPPAEKRDIQTYTDVKDGSYYFHLKFKGQNTWGESANFAFHIDSTKPDLLEVKPAQDVGPASTASFDIRSHDETSGIDHYEMKIDAMDPAIWKDTDSTGRYETPALSKGKHTLQVRAVDKAGNFSEQTVEMNVLGIDAPKITDSPKDLEIGDALVVSGSSYPNTQIILYIQGNFEEAIEYHTETNHLGRFSARYTGILSKNMYKIWAVAVDKNDMVSDSSMSVVTNVTKHSIGRFFTDNVEIIITLFLPIFFILVTILAFIVYILKELQYLKKKVEEGFLSKENEKDQELIIETSKEVKEKILKKLSLLMVLPKDEEPIISTVDKLQTLKNHPFFSQAKRGDILVAYEKAQKSILYDEINNRVIDIYR